jgi:hypothetical protein
VSRQGHSIPGISYAIHEAKRGFRQPTVAEVILDDHVTLGNPNGFTQQQLRLLNVVQHVHKHHDVHLSRLVWKRPAVELAHRYPCSRPLQYIDAFNFQIRTTPLQHCRQLPVATTHICDGRIPRNESLKPTDQSFKSPLLNINSMYLLKDIHQRRRIPRILTKKLDKTV